MPPPGQRPSERLSEASEQRRTAKQQKQNEAFLKGPIPLPWLCGAARLPGKALLVGLIAYYKVGLTQKTKGLKLSTALFEKFGVSRQAAYRGLAALESAGLVSVDRRLGRCPQVTIRKKGIKA